MNTSHFRSGFAVLVLIAAGWLAGCQDGGTMASIRIEPENATIARGTDRQFIALAVFSDGVIVNWTAAADWSSSDPDALSMTNTPGRNGIATSLTGTGTYSITAADIVNGISSTAILTVTDPSSVAILPARPYMAKGTSHQFTAIADLVSDGTLTQNITSCPTITCTLWSSSETATATVDDTTGLVTAVAAGTTDILATHQESGLTGSTTLTVTDAPVDRITITLDPDVANLLKATGYYLSGQFDFSSSVIWTSSNTAVASIDQEGLMTPLSSGTTTITATDPITGKAATYQLTVP